MLALAAFVVMTCSSVLHAAIEAESESDAFAFRDGDTVVFLGDSITAARTYGQIIENYTHLRFPSRRVHFINAGLGGDTATGGAARLETDVFPHNPTVLLVAYGVNDIGWGFNADDAHKQAYLDGIREIVSRAGERGVRVYICSAAITHEDPDVAADGFLQQMCDEGMAIARDLGHHSIDVQRGMRAIQRRILASKAFGVPDADTPDDASLHVADGVHLSDLGQLAMAFVILKGLNAPADVSHAAIDAALGEVTAADNCTILNLRSTSDTITFTRLDKGLPLNFGLFGALQFRYVPVPDNLNRYMLTVSRLRAGRYELAVDGRVVGTYPHHALAQGVNIASATSNVWEPGGPWDAQCTSLIALTQARAEIAQSLQNWNVYLATSDDRQLIDNDINAIDYRLRELQRTVSRPMRYEFVLTRVE